MVKNFLHMFLRRLWIVAAIFIAAFPSLFSQEITLPNTGLIASLLSHACISLFPPGRDIINTQTLAYISQTELQNKINTSFDRDIKNIGEDFFKKLFRTVLKRERDFNKGYDVFYHGQKREFILFQDLYKGLYQIVCKRLLDTFVPLRVPDNDFTKFTNINDFLHYYIKSNEFSNCAFDHRPHIRKLLLPVNASLFGNSYNSGECTFYYFVNSYNIKDFDILDLVEDIFKSFPGYEKYFLRYKKEITNLNKLLSKEEKDKTGLLIQIFVPENQVDSLAYCCKPFGDLYFNDNKPENHPATEILNNYKQSKSWKNREFDEIQFRLLINKSMLDPNSDIKFFRYYKKTAGVKIYEKRVKKLLSKIATDVEITAAAT
jgi:hypothetical protein